MPLTTSYFLETETGAIQLSGLHHSIVTLRPDVEKYQRLDLLLSGLGNLS